MSTNQLFFSIVGVFFGLTGILVSLATFFKHYLDAKLDPMQQQLRQLIDYMVLHQGKIASLEERTKNL